MVKFLRNENKSIVTAAEGASERCWGGMDCQEHQETLGSHGYVHQLVCRNGIMGGTCFLKLPIVHFKYATITLNYPQ